MKVATCAASMAALTIGAAASAGVVFEESFDGTLSADGQLDFYTFSIADDVMVGGPNWLNIQTFLTDGATDTVDTEIGVYDSGGMLVANDDDDNSDGHGFGLYSMLSFGDADPLFTDDTPAGADGDIAAGMYTIVVGGFNTTFTPSIDDVTGGASTGDYTLLISTNVPAPGAAALLGVAGLVGLRRRR